MFNCKATFLTNNLFVIPGRDDDLHATTSIIVMERLREGDKVGPNKDFRHNYRKIFPGFCLHGHFWASWGFQVGIRLLKKDPFYWIKNI